LPKSLRNVVIFPTDASFDHPAIQQVATQSGRAPEYKLRHRTLRTMSPTKRFPSSSPAPTTPTKKKASNSSSAVTPSPKRSKESFPIEAKRAIIERALDMAYKNLPWGELAKEVRAVRAVLIHCWFMSRPCFG
jgi:hypothetical protein